MSKPTWVTKRIGAKPGKDNTKRIPTETDPVEPPPIVIPPPIIPTYIYTRAGNIITDRDGVNIETRGF
jgi:hypothetical protein